MTTPFPFVSGATLTAQNLNDIQNLPISDKTTSYVLVVADAYKRTIMNSASATTITVNNNIFTVGDVIQLANKGAGICTVTAGVGVTINTSSSLALAQYGGGYLLCLSASTFTFFSAGGAVYGTATGGIGSPTSVTISGTNYQYLQFNSTGTLTVTKAGLFDVLIFGGGGAGGSSGSGAYTGGGGGAGGIVSETIYLSANATITIGAGGTSAVSTTGTNGGGSSVKNTAAAVNAIGGGFAGWTNAGVSNNVGYRGASGGGGLGGQTAPSSTGLTSLFDAIIGYSGGNGSTTANQAAGGGGGATAIGANAVTTTGGAGGAGYDVSAFIGGGALFKAGGGGGGAPVAGVAGAGGSSVGGAGTLNATGNAAAANTAGGGGGAGSSGGSFAGGSGGSGIAYIRWKV